MVINLFLGFGNEFQATDQRGGCPGLNSKFTLVFTIVRVIRLRLSVSHGNYGYIDRTGSYLCCCTPPPRTNLWSTPGVTIATELIWAQQEMLGLAPDIAAILVGLVAVSCLDLTT